MRLSGLWSAKAQAWFAVAQAQHWFAAPQGQHWLASPQGQHWLAAAQAQGWASCPLNQNTVLSIPRQQRYANTPESPGVVAPLVTELILFPQPQF